MLESPDSIALRLQHRRNELELKFGWDRINDQIKTIHEMFKRIQTMKRYVIVNIKEKEESNSSLHVCDRKVQPGDKLKECNKDGVERTIHHFESILPYGIWAYTDGEWIRCDQAWKVIGKVPESCKVFVHRHDEFEENEISVQPMYERYEPHDFKYNYISIKGPCGHFH